MDERINRIAALANISAYHVESASKYIDGAPHIKHISFRKLYDNLAVQVFDNATNYAKIPKST